MQSSALPTGRMAHWKLGFGREAEVGNPCVGIAIGCVLSMPIWLAIFVLYTFWA